MSALKRKISVIGLGYVGLPVAIGFAEAGFKVVGFDTNVNRIDELKKGHDKTFEVENRRLDNPNMTYSDKAEDIQQANFHIITVPTPITNTNEPDSQRSIRVAPKMIAYQCLRQSQNLQPDKIFTLVTHPNALIPAIQIIDLRQS